MPSKEIKGGRGKLGLYDFYIRFDGKRHRKRVACPRSAVRDIYRRWEAEVFAGKTKGSRRLFEILDDYLKWEVDNKAERFVSQERHHFQRIKEFFGNVSIGEIKRPTVIDFRAWKLKEGSSPATVNRYLSSLSCFFNWCIEREFAESNPASRTKLKEENKRVILLTPDQIKEFLDCSDAYQKVWAYLAIFTGMRRGEICGLKWSQVNLDAGLIRIEGYQTKSGDPREIAMSETLIRFLQIHRSENPENSHVIMFRGKRVRAIKRSFLSLRDSLPWAKEMKLRFHDLRHVYATSLRQAGVELSEIKELLGHADVRTTERYAHFSQTKRSTVNKLDTYIFGKP